VRAHHLKIDCNLTARIQRQTKAEGTTPHGALMAAMQLAGGRTRPEWLSDGLHCNTPHDVRRALPDAGSMTGMLTMPLITFLRPVAGRSFWEMAREYRNDLLQHRGAREKLAFVHQMDALTADELTPATFFEKVMNSPIQYDLMITDFAQYRPAVHYGSMHLADIATGNNGGSPRTQTIGVCTLDGCMNLTQISMQPIEGLLETAAEILSEVCSE
jgi:hypothetical protein